MMMSKSGQKGNACLFLDLKGNVINYSLLNIPLALGLLKISFIRLMKFSYIPSFLNFIMNGHYGPE